MWFVPMVASNLSLVYWRLVSLKFIASPALLINTDSFFSVARKSSTNFRTDSRSARSSCTRRISHYIYVYSYTNYIVDRRQTERGQQGSGTVGRFSDVVKDFRFEENVKVNVDLYSASS